MKETPLRYSSNDNIEKATETTTRTTTFNSNAIITFITKIYNYDYVLKFIYKVKHQTSHAFHFLVPLCFLSFASVWYNATYRCVASQLSLKPKQK